MKKIANYSIIAYLVLLGALLLVGPYIFEIINQYGTQINDYVYNNRVVYLVIAIIVSIILSVFVYELGHILGAKIGRYKVYGVNFFNILFYKTRGKRKMTVEMMDGFSGETKITPLSEKTNPKAFFFGGTMFSFIIIIGLLLPGLIFTTEIPSYIRVGMDVFAIALMCIVIYNIFPLHFDTTTDGYMLTLVSKKENGKAFNILCQMKYDLMQGNPIEIIPAYEEINYITSQINMFLAFELIYAQKYEEALAVIDKLAEASDKCYEKVWENIASQKVFLYMQLKSVEETKELYFDKLGAKDRKMIFENKTLEGERTIMLISSCFEESESEVKISLKRYYEHAKKEKNAPRLDKENILLEVTLKQIKNLHPDWKFEITED